MGIEPTTSRFYNHTLCLCTTTGAYHVIIQNNGSDGKNGGSGIVGSIFFIFLLWYDQERRLVPPLKSQTDSIAEFINEAHLK